MKCIFLKDSLCNEMDFENNFLIEVVHLYIYSNHSNYRHIKNLCKVGIVYHIKISVL
jgi:hypothetical protein